MKQYYSVCRGVPGVYENSERDTKSERERERKHERESKRETKREKEKKRDYRAWCTVS